MGFHHPARLFRRVGINNCSGALLCFSKCCWIEGERLCIDGKDYIYGLCVTGPGTVSKFFGHESRRK